MGARRPEAERTEAARADRRLAAGALDLDDARRIAEALVRRHRAAARSFEDTPDAAAYGRALRRALDVLEPCAGSLGAPALAEVARCQARFLEERADLLLARVGDGRILAEACELGLADVVLPAGAEGEEAPEARIEPAEPPGVGQAGRPGRAPAEVGADDVALELAGISLALLAGGRAGPAERLLSHYAGEADDFDLYGVIDFHERAVALRRAARAVRRAEAAPGSAPDSASGSARRDEALAAALEAVGQAQARRSLLPPVVVAMGGSVASGKSTLARALADRMAAPRVVADRVRDHLLARLRLRMRRSQSPRAEAADATTARGAARAARAAHEVDWAHAVEPGFRARVYAEMLRRGGMVAGSGRAVVLDACFPRPGERSAARALARRHGFAFRLVECRVDAQTLRARLVARDAASPDGGWREIAERLDARTVPASDDELPVEERIVVDTGRPLEASLEELVAWL